MENEAITGGVEKKGDRAKRGLAIAVLVAMLAGAGYFALSWCYFYWNAPERKNSDMAYLWQWKMYAQGMEKAYTADTYGGVTPEETLQLFIDALKAGDIQLAAKYYIPEKQGGVLADFESSKLPPSPKYLEYLEGFLAHPEASNATGTNMYFLSYPYGADGFATSIRFTQNSLTKKWKLVE
jgi:hypothetical protein